MVVGGVEMCCVGGRRVKDGGLPRRPPRLALGTHFSGVSTLTLPAESGVLLRSADI